MSEYAKITSTTWDRTRPARSEVSAGLGKEGFWFEHELGCPMQGSMAPDACTCYVSRIRLVKTPVGRTIATTEPDLSTHVRFWHKEARRSARLAAAGWSMAAASALLNVLYGLQAM